MNSLFGLGGAVLESTDLEPQVLDLGLGLTKPGDKPVLGIAGLQKALFECRYQAFI